MKTIFFLILFTIPPAYINSQSLQGINKAVLLKYESDDIKNLSVTPSMGSISDKLRNNISYIEIAEMMSIREFENASISVHYDIFKDPANSQYYGAVRMEVRRNMIDSRFIPPLFEPIVYRDFIYVLLTNPNNEYLRDVLDKHTDTLIRDFTKFYYQDNPK